MLEESSLTVWKYLPTVDIDKYFHNCWILYDRSVDTHRCMFVHTAPVKNM